MTAELFCRQTGLYEKFGKQNGGSILCEYFDDVLWSEYEDSLEVTKPEALISYVLSCHGNQNRFIVDRYSDFVAFVKKKTKDGFTVTKEAVFLRRLREIKYKK